MKRAAITLGYTLAFFGVSAFAQPTFEDGKANLRSAGISEDTLTALEDARRRDVIDAYVAGRTEGLQYLLAEIKKSTRLEVLEVLSNAKSARAGGKGKKIAPGKRLALVMDSSGIAAACDLLFEHIRIGEAKRLSFGDDGALRLTDTIASHEEVVCCFRFTAELITYEVTIWPRSIEFTSSVGKFVTFHGAFSITPESSSLLRNRIGEGDTGR